MIHAYDGKTPKIDPTAWVAQSADVVGDVELGAEASIFFQCVVRADVHRVRIGARTNIQDQCTIHVSKGTHPTIIYEDVTLGHRVIVHGAEVHPGALIGIGSIVLDGCVIEEGAMVGANSLVTAGTVVPAGKLVLGSPARVVRDVTDADREWMATTVATYMGLAQDYKRSGS
jgi:carbonic anhydrase/acetyltransferase-like protein (isoleucine patch superfamily)